MKRAATALAAALYLLVAVSLLPAMRDPSGVTAAGPDGCPDGSYGWTDVLTYAALAVVLVLVAAALLTLVRNFRHGGGPWWLIAVPIVVLGVGLATTGSESCGAFGLGAGPGTPSDVPAILAAAVAVFFTIGCLMLLRRRRREEEP